MKFLLDENFPCSCAEVIVSCGHEAVPFAEVCKFGDDDETVFAAAQRLGAVLLTSDRDFYHTMPLLQGAAEAHHFFSARTRRQSSAGIVVPSMDAVSLL